MAIVLPPVKNDISGTAPNPSNAVARTAFGKLHDYLMNLLGSAGSPEAARAALDVKQLQSIEYTLAANALTLKLNPTNLDFRSTTLTSGAPANVANAAQLTTVISSGSTAGAISAVQSDIILLAINNAGTMELAWTNLAGGLNLDETNLITTVAEGGAGAADSANVIYSTTARTNVAYRVVGIFRSTQTVAGTWAQTPTLVQPIGGITPIKSLPSMVRVTGGNGYGSTNTVIRRYSNTITNQGQDITYTDSATLGASFTINTTGVYAISVSDIFNAVASIGVSVNSTTLTTGILAISSTEKIAASTSAAADLGVNASATASLLAGAIVRPHAGAAVPNGVNNGGMFIITRVA